MNNAHPAPPPPGWGDYISQGKKRARSREKCLPSSRTWAQCKETRFNSNFPLVFVLWLRLNKHIYNITYVEDGCGVAICWGYSGAGVHLEILVV